MGLGLGMTGFFVWLVCQCNLLLRLSVCGIGRLLAEQADGTIPETILREHEPEVSIMQRHGLVVRNSEGVFQLTSFSNGAAVILGNPQSPRSFLGDSPDELTVVELRLDLVKAGWTLVDKPSECQIESRLCMRCQSHSYFTLLLHSFDQVVQLARMNAFSHSQQKAYYATIALVCETFPAATLMH